MKNPLVSVIIPVWNGGEHLPTCLWALQAQTYAPLEIIAVDNASEDGSAELLAASYPAVRLLRNSKNLGFAGGCNAGLRAAQGEVLILLNQDTEVEPAWAEELAALFQRDASIGIAGCKAFYPDGSLQHAGGYIDLQGGGHHYQEEQAEEGALGEVDFVTGAALAISRQAFEQIGDLDEGFAPAYYEDVDWCYRARLAGYRVVYLPTARLIHKEISSLADISHEGMYLPHRNRLRFVFKHWSLLQLSNDFLPTEQAWLKGLAPGGERLVAAMYHAYLFHLLHLDDLLSWRQRLLASSAKDIDVLADVLITLRRVVPLRPAGIEPQAKAEEVRVAQRQEQQAKESEQKPPKNSLLLRLEKQWRLREHQFDSQLPKIGRVISTIRHLWYSVAAKWSVRELIHQQSQVNALMLQLLTELQHKQTGLEHHLKELDYSVNVRLELLENKATQESYDRQRLAEVLAEYLSEHGREVAEIAHLLQSLSPSSDELTK